MKTRFWQRIYLLILVLFLLFLNIAVFSFAYYTYGEKVSACTEAFSAEQKYVLSSIERDLAFLEEEQNVQDVLLVFKGYLSHYEQNGTALAFYEAEKEAPLCAASLFEELSEKGRQGTLSHKRINGVRHVLIVSSILDGRYEMCYLREASEIDRDLKGLILTFVPLSAGLSMVLALILFFVLKRTSRPLQELKDVTERYAAGETSVRAEVKGKDEFAALSASFNEMLATIEAQMRDLEVQSSKNKRLVDNMAHEIRTPLTVVRGYAEVISRAAVDEETKIESAERIIEESKRLSGISEKILEMAILENEELNREVLKVEDLVDKTKAHLTSFAQKRGVLLECETEECVYAGDPTLLSMLLYNLTENAVKSCADGGRVLISCKKSENEVRIIVSDNGKGLTPEQLLRITEPFYRTDKARSRKDGGAGLGLALCKSIVECHGGRICFDSQPNSGTKVEVILQSECVCKEEQCNEK